MAWIFEVSIECGPSREAADAVTRYFDLLRLDFPNGLSSLCRAESKKYSDGNWWCLVYPDGAARYGGYYSQLQEDGTEKSLPGELRFETDEQMNELILALYDRLRQSPPYRYASIGYDSEFFRDWSEIIEEDYTAINFSGLVLSEPLCSLSGKPSQFVPFAPGYVWWPYQENRF